ncbi:MAG: hypothetical protein ACUVTL_08415, partial [Thermoproteota archaeon]
MKYIILTFDIVASSNVKTQTLYNYLTIFQKKLKTVYIDENLAVFELTADDYQPSKNWRLLFLDQNKSSILTDVFCNSYYLIIYDNLPLDVTYIQKNYIGRAFDLLKLNKMEISATLNLKETADSYYIYPFFLVLPRVTERLCLVAEFKPSEKSWNIYSGIWSAETLKWSYTLLTESKSNKLSFTTNFTNSNMVIADNSSRTIIPMPQEWIDIIHLRLESSNETTQNLWGKIGIFAGKNLTDIAFVDDFSLKVYGDITTLPTSTPFSLLPLSSERVSPILYKATINANESFTLALLDAYNPQWHAYVNGKRIDSVPLYGVVNGFYVNQTGLLDVVIEYEPQRWFYIGCT